MVRLVLGADGRIRDVQAYERDGALLVEWTPLSLWMYRALSPLDVRLRERDRPYTMLEPVYRVLFSEIPTQGLRMRVTWDGEDTWRQDGDGVWIGHPRLDVRVQVTQRFDRELGFVVGAEAEVIGEPRRAGSGGYHLTGSVHYLGEASVRGLDSEVVPSL